LAALYGALFGFFAHANFAIMKVWTLRVTLLDIGWGVLRPQRRRACDTEITFAG
jgi:uncharacterized membrane protein